MNEEVQETPQKSNKIAIIISAVIVVLFVLLILLVFGKSKDGTGKNNIDIQKSIPPITDEEKTEIEKRMQKAREEIPPLTDEEKATIKEKLKQFNTNN